MPINKESMTMGPLGTAAAGVGMGIVNNVSNLVFGRAIQKQQLKGYKESLAAQNEAAYDLWDRTNYDAQVKQMKKAGLNPALLYGMGGGAGGQTGGGGAMPQAGAGHGMDIAGAAQLALLKAQTDNIRADTANKQQDTKLKGANTIIQEVLGWQAQMDYEDFYEWEKDAEGYIVAKNKNRELRINNQQKTLESGIATATNIIEQFKNGNLAKMSQAELDNKLKEIGVKEGQIQKNELENKLTEMEIKLQEKIGLGKDGKGWVEMGVNLILNMIKLSMLKKK